ncbi:MAG: arylamine N-acetyltransferase [Colwellia sp.]|nr:arylamine N-acetyltransferase [Colwellia sp.]
MLNNRQVAQYLKRINFQHSLNDKKSTLVALHQAHMLSVPFENIDIHLGNKIRLSLPLLFEKIVMKNRGGFCYELNYLFAALLHSCGFKVNLLSAQVFDGDLPGREFEHLLLLVESEGIIWICDVGFGDSFIRPLKLNTEPVEQLGYLYKVTSQDEKYVLFRKKIDGRWMPQYLFSLTPQKIGSFTQMCEYQQTSPESTFTKKSVCSIATESGRLTLSNGKFIETSNGNRSEKLIASSKHYRQVLQQYFIMLLPDNISLTQWEKLGL